MPGAQSLLMFKEVLKICCLMMEEGGHAAVAGSGDGMICYTMTRRKQSETLLGMHIWQPWISSSVHFKKLQTICVLSSFFLCDVI